MTEVLPRVYCSVPAYDEGIEIGSCGWFIPAADEPTQRQLAKALGWSLEPTPMCPGHAQVHGRGL
jgi:hypothetical protein